MRLTLVFLLLVTMLQGASLSWSRSYDTSLEQAKAQNKILMIYLRMPGCGACRFMEENTYTDADVKAMINEHFVNVKLYSNDLELPEHLRMEVSPVIHFINPADGSTIETMIGGKNAEKFLDLLKDVHHDYLSLRKAKP